MKESESLNFEVEDVELQLRLGKDVDLGSNCRLRPDRVGLPPGRDRAARAGATMRKDSRARIEECRYGQGQIVIVSTSCTLLAEARSRTADSSLSSRSWLTRAFGRASNSKAQYHCHNTHITSRDYPISKYSFPELLAPICS